MIDIYSRLAEEGYAANNVVLGFGSYTYQYVTRDTFGFALKVTHGIVDGAETFMFKDPITDRGATSAGKKSQKGMCIVKQDAATGAVSYTDQHYMEEADTASWSQKDEKDKEIAQKISWLRQLVVDLYAAAGLDHLEVGTVDVWYFSWKEEKYEIGCQQGLNTIYYVQKTEGECGRVIALDPYAEETLSGQVTSWIKCWFRDNGRKTAVLGISSGKDSAVVAGLCTEALGPENVFGVMMPNGEQPDIDDSKRVIKSLGIPDGECNIRPVCDAIAKCVEEATGLSISGNAAINTTARVRMAILYAIAQTLSDEKDKKACVVGIGNRSEYEVGYTTKGGDSVCDVAPIRGLWVHEVLQVGDEITALPEDIVHKVPDDGLSGLSDEEKLGVSYKDIYHYCVGTPHLDAGTARRVRELYEHAAHKREPIPVFRKEWTVGDG